MVQKDIKIGLLSNEFFDLELGRMGGFGWAAHQVVNFFKSSPELNAKITFLAGSTKQLGKTVPTHVHGVPIIYRSKNPLRYMNMLRKQKFDVLLTIDYRSSYRKVLNFLPYTPTIIWVRDPRTMEDAKRVQSIRLPCNNNLVPQGLEYVDCRSASTVVKRSKLLGRKIIFAATTPYLLFKIPETYGVYDANTAILPNIINFSSNNARQSTRPNVVFLGRLDPYKRPWLFMELATHFPDVDFTFLGQSHFEGEGAWEPKDFPKNVHFKGHVNELEKEQLLAQAWVLVNTSLHEGLAVSFLEALKLETPLLASVNPENVVSRFGVYVGNYTGDGRDSIPYFAAGMSRLLENANIRDALGKEGRKWVETVHTKEAFLNSFKSIVSTFGVEYLCE